MHRLLALPLLGLASCATTGGRDAASGQPTEWTVSPNPTVTIDDQHIPPGHELAGISSARRLVDGRIVLANTGGSELLAFDSTGDFQQVVGRKGGGPGEFQSYITVFGYRGDSVAVFDGQNARWTVFSADLTPVRTVLSADRVLSSPTWVYRGALIESARPEPASGWMLSTLDSIRSTDPEYQHLIRARTDDLGALWVADTADRSLWRVYPGGGAAAGLVTLPPGAEYLQADQSHLLVLRRDADGVESVQQYELSRPVQLPGAVAAAVLPHRTDEAGLLDAARHLVADEEMHYANLGRYAGPGEELKRTAGTEFTLFLLSGDKRHWAAVLVDPLTGVTCGLWVGGRGWPTWNEGEPTCEGA